MKERFAGDLGAERRLLEDLRQRGLLDDGEMKVRVRDRVAYIQGCIESTRQQRLVEEIATRVEGVDEVHNELRVTPTTVANNGGQQVTNDVPLVKTLRSDAEIVKEIRQGFSECLEIGTSSVHVVSREGVVLLSGVVGNIYVRAAAEERARWTPSVVDVDNELEVVANGSYAAL